MGLRERQARAPPDATISRLQRHPSEPEKPGPGPARPPRSERGDGFRCGERLPINRKPALWNGVRNAKRSSRRPMRHVRGCEHSEIHLQSLRYARSAMVTDHVGTECKNAAVASPGRASLDNSVSTGPARPRNDWHRPRNQHEGIRVIHRGAAGATQQLRHREAGAQESDQANDYNPAEVG